MATLELSLVPDEFLYFKMSNSKVKFGWILGIFFLGSVFAGLFVEDERMKLYVSTPAILVFLPYLFIVDAVRKSVQGRWKMHRGTSELFGRILMVLTIGIGPLMLETIERRKGIDRNQFNDS